MVQTYFSLSVCLKPERNQTLGKVRAILVASRCQPVQIVCAKREKSNILFDLTLTIDAEVWIWRGVDNERTPSSPLPFHARRLELVASLNLNKLDLIRSIRRGSVFVGKSDDEASST